MFTSFVLGFVVEVEEAALEEHFLDCGGIVAVRILRNPLTGVGRGFGYVLFEVWETNVLMLLEMSVCVGGGVVSVLCCLSDNAVI